MDITEYIYIYIYINNGDIGINKGKLARKNGDTIGYLDD